MTRPSKEQIQRWRRDPIAFIRDVLRNPENGKPFELYAEEERFLREALTPNPDGSLPYSELLFGAPKKSGKSTLSALAMLYVVICLSGTYGEGIILANDEQQATDRIYQACLRIVRASPLLRHSAKVTGNRIVFTSTGSTITAISGDYAGAAGSNPNFICADEIWGFTSERAHRLFDETLPSPTRRASARLVTTYAGFPAESVLLESLYRRGVAGDLIGPDLYRSEGMLTFWTNRLCAPWQTESWRASMEKTLRANQYKRMIQNLWTSSNDVFLSLAEWDSITDAALAPVFQDRALEVYAGVDASTKHDSTALAAVAWDSGRARLRLVNLRVFQPSPDAPLDFQSSIEATLLEWKARYQLQECRCDPWQMASSAQTLRRAGINIAEFAQTPANLSAMASNIYELVRSRTLSVYPDEPLRRAVGQAIAIEGARGWKIDKAKQSHKIDPLVALSMACLAAVAATGNSVSQVPMDAVLMSTRNMLAGGNPFAGIPAGDPLRWSDPIFSPIARG